MAPLGVVSSRNGRLSALVCLCEHSRSSPYPDADVHQFPQPRQIAGFPACPARRVERRSEARAPIWLHGERLVVYARRQVGKVGEHQRWACVLKQRLIASALLDQRAVGRELPQHRHCPIRDDRASRCGPTLSALLARPHASRSAPRAESRAASTARSPHLRQHHARRLGCERHCARVPTTEQVPIVGASSPEPAGDLVSGPLVGRSRR